jgi:nucleoside-diphosphate-sugar epimerase
MNARQVHVVFGAGQIGTPLARLLAARGNEVRIVRRPGSRTAVGRCAPSRDALPTSTVPGPRRRTSGSRSLLLAALGWFVPILREVSETRYQWDEPFVVDDRRFRERFGSTPTGLDEGVPAMVAWARETYGSRPA